MRWGSAEETAETCHSRGDVLKRSGERSGRGRGNGGRGVWLTIWTDDVDAVHGTCAREGLVVLRPPQDEPWAIFDKTCTLHLRRHSAYIGGMMRLEDHPRGVSETTQGRDVGSALSDLRFRYANH